MQCGFYEEEREVKCHACQVAESRLVSESESALSGRCHGKNTLAGGAGVTTA
jgi:hypothetical protein